MRPQILLFVLTTPTLLFAAALSVAEKKAVRREMIEMDIFYAGKMSVWLDLTIIFRTLPALISQVREASGSREMARTPPLRGSTAHVPIRPEG